MWAVLVIAMASTVGLVRWKQRARRVYVIDHVKLELHPAHIVEDRVVEAVWRAAISMTNTSRRPRSIPVLAERATVRAGGYVYLADVYLDVDVRELNPRGVALAWIEFALPGDAPAPRIDTGILDAGGRSRTLRWAGSSAASEQRPVTVS
ncbi:hypothetical protein GCM10010462_20420 [Microbacterium dextranolyticum]|uniref:Uncharacterized protein n=2 Tax=Microbacterium dextranolyticum TaxID=36806 RepID=A0A9W6HKK3_9MICO|nr:hypothetical protein GCM10017591_04970 [Microbacterium dextranolyticum]